MYIWHKVTTVYCMSNVHWCHVNSSATNVSPERKFSDIPSLRRCVPHYPSLKVPSHPQSTYIGIVETGSDLPTQLERTLQLYW